MVRKKNLSRPSPSSKETSTALPSIVTPFTRHTAREKQGPKENLTIGIIFMVLATLAFSSMSGTIKFAEERGASAFQTLFSQSAICLIIVTPIVIIRWGLAGFRTHHFGLHLVRDFAGFFSFAALFLTIPHLSLVNAILLLNTGPLFIPVILRLWVHIKMPHKLWLGIVVGFAGIIVILQPGAGVLQPMMFVGLISGLGMGITFVALRKLNATEGPYVILFYLFLVTTLCSFPLALWQWHPLEPHMALALVITALLFLLGQSFLIIAFEYGQASVLSSLAYLMIVWSALIDWIFWGSVPDTMTILGVALVILGGVLSILLGRTPSPSHRFPSPQA